GRVLKPERRTRDGAAFTVATPDFVTAAVELEGGVLARLTTNFYVGHHGKQRGVELHGDLGSLYLASWQEPNSAVEVAEFGGAYERLGDFSGERMRWGEDRKSVVEGRRGGRGGRRRDRK